MHTALGIENISTPPNVRGNNVKTSGGSKSRPGFQLNIFVHPAAAISASTGGEARADPRYELKPKQDIIR